MLYAILCYDSEDVISAWPKEKDEQVMRDLGAVQEKLTAEGKLGPVARLMPTTAAVSLRKGKDSLIIDGPFAETKEQLLGFFVVDCTDLDDAVSAAQQLAAASGSAGCYEVRPLAIFHPGNLPGSLK